MERRCKICGRMLKVTQGDVGPVCAGRQKTRKNSISKKAYLRAIKQMDIFGGINGQGKTKEAELQLEK